MVRIAICSLIVGFGALAAAQDLSQKVSVDIPASRASVALKALSDATGVHFEPAANLKDEVFVIHATDVTIQQIMDRIAQAESGRWSLQSGMYLLVRESSTSVAQERAELKARAKSIQQAIDKLTAGVKKHPNFDEATAQKLTDETRKFSEQISKGSGATGPVKMQADLDTTPTARAMAAILSSIDVNRLAQIAPNQRVVFSTNPTMMQIGLGGAGANAFQRFVNEQSTYSRVYNQGQASDGRSTVFSFNGLSSPNMGRGNASRGLGVGLAVVQRRFGNDLSVEILAADPDYETICSGSYNLDVPDLQPKDVKAADQEKPLEISAEAKEMAKALNPSAGEGTSEKAVVMVSSVSIGLGSGGNFFVASDDRGGAQIKLSPGLRAKVLDPMKYDPLSFVPGQAVAALGKARGENLVALLPDTCFGSMTRQFATDVTPSQLLSTLESMHGLTAEEGDGWMVISPMSPYTARVNKVDRSAVASLLREMDQDKTLRLDSVAGFAVSQDKIPGFEDIDILYPRMIDSALTDASLTPLASGSFSLYKFYGLLPPASRQAVAAGRQIRLGMLSSQMKGLVADMVYNSPQGPQIQVAPRQGNQREESVAITAFQSAGGRALPIMMGGPLSALSERTIVLPNGVPADGYLTGTLKVDQVAQAKSSQTGGESFMDAGSLAFNRNLSTQANSGRFTPPQYDQFRMARRTTVSISFFLSPQAMMPRSLTDTSAEKDARYGAFDSLPAEFRNQVEAMEKNLKNAFGKMPGGNQATPPP